MTTLPSPSPSPSPSPAPSVDSEVGVLREVVVHRPDLELARLTPGNIEELLFDDVLWAKRAREEHDAFVGALQDQGVQVHHYADLLGDVLDLPQGRAFVLDRVCTPEQLGVSLVDPVRCLFDGLPGRELARLSGRRSAQGRHGP